jgi:hypothetical protein
MDRDDIPTEAEQALYLVTELSWLMERSRIETWPQYQADLFLQQLREIVAKAELHRSNIR